MCRKKALTLVVLSSVINMQASLLLTLRGQDIVINVDVGRDDRAGNGNISEYGKKPYGSLAGNSITINKGGNAGRVSGAHSEVVGSYVMNNKAIMNGGQVATICGGELEHKGICSKNTVTINGGQIIDNVYGGHGFEDGSALYNEVEFNGYEGNDLYGGFIGENGEAGYNKVTINSGYIKKSVYGGKVFSGNSFGNHIDIAGGQIDDSVYGGAVVNNGQATSNKVNISSGTAVVVLGGYVHGHGKVEKNVVEIRGGCIKDGIVGGGVEQEGESIANKIVISGGQHGDSGGMYGVVGGVVEDGAATNNVIEISGSPVFSTGTFLYGGHCIKSGNSFTGNTLNIKTNGVKVLEVKNFEKYNFYSPTKKRLVMLEAAKAIDLAGCKVKLHLNDVQGGFEVGDRYVLMVSSSGIKNYDKKCVEGMYERVLERYVFSSKIAVGDTELEVELSGIEINPKDEILTQSVGIGLIFVMDDGSGGKIREELKAELNKSKLLNLKPFVVIDGGSSRYEKGETEIGGVKVAAGLTKGINILYGKIAVGGYVEYGNGKYNTRGIFEGSEVKGKGKTKYVGIGLMGRLEKGSMYVDLMGRLGKHSNDFDSEGMGYGGQDVNYKKENMYAGGLVGVGYKRKITKKVGIDVNGALNVIREPGKEVTLDTEDVIKFEGITMCKTKVGIKGEYEAKERIKPYIGLGYEEMMGKAQGKLKELALPNRELKGGSFVGGIGINAELWKINIGCGLECYTGIREGIDGMLKVKYYLS
jgi:hypothetical protein